MSQALPLWGRSLGVPSGSGGLAIRRLPGVENSRRGASGRGSRGVAQRRVAKTIDRIHTRSPDDQHLHHIRVIVKGVPGNAVMLSASFSRGSVPPASSGGRGEKLVVAVEKSGFEIRRLTTGGGNHSCVGVPRATIVLGESRNP